MRTWFAESYFLFLYPDDNHTSTFIAPTFIIMIRDDRKYSKQKFMNLGSFLLRYVKKIAVSFRLAEIKIEVIRRASSWEPLPQSSDSCCWRYFVYIYISTPHTCNTYNVVCKHVHTYIFKISQFQIGTVPFGKKTVYAACRVKESSLNTAFSI